MSCNSEVCDGGWEIRIHPETQENRAFGCKHCKPHLRHIQINQKFEDANHFQDAVLRRNNRLKEGDSLAK